MITPLHDRDALDLPGLERLIEHILAGGVHGLFVLGTSGEAPSLGYQLRRELVDRVCRQVAGRLPVLVGITDTAFTESVRLAQHAADCGAQAVVTSAPYYFPAGQAELVEYIEHLAPQLPLPLFLYNMPAMTKIQFQPDTLRRLLHLENVVGLKDSSGDLAYFNQVVTLTRERPGWTLLVGPEELLAETVQQGGHGGVNGGANIFPHLFVALYQAATSGQAAQVQTLQEHLLKLGRIYQVGQYASAIIKGIKCALALRGICNDYMAEPFHRFRAPEREKVRAVLEELGPQIAGPL